MNACHEQIKNIYKIYIYLLKCYLIRIKFNVKLGHFSHIELQIVSDGSGAKTVMKHHIFIKSQNSPWKLHNL